MDIPFIFQLIILILIFVSIVISHYHLLHIYIKLKRNNKNIKVDINERTQLASDAINHKNEYALLIESSDRVIYKILYWGRKIGLFAIFTFFVLHFDIFS